MGSPRSERSEGQASDVPAIPENEQRLRAELYAQQRADKEALNDPFLSHNQGAQPAGRPWAQRGANAGQPPAGLGVPEEDPFMEYNVARDPFMTRTAEEVGQGAFAAYSSTAAGPHDKLSVELILGRGDTSRHPMTFRAFVLIPWLVYMWVLWLWLFMRHYSIEATIVLTAVIFAVFAVMIGLGTMGRRGTAMVSLPLMGVFCLLAAVVAACSSGGLWENGWREFWWTQTGFRFKDKSSTTPARSLLDAATIDFGSNPQDPTLVAHDRSAGHVDGRIYCAAPVLQAAGSDAPILRVNYWAVGLDCCATYGSFQCDASRTHTGAHAVVVRNGTFPCDDCRPELFAYAVQKAEAAFGLASARDALMVRWVSDPAPVINDMRWEGFLDLFLSCIGALSILTIVIFFIWYYGWLRLAPGARSKSGSLLPLAPSSPYFVKKNAEQAASEAYAGYRTFNCGTAAGQMPWGCR